MTIHIPAHVGVVAALCVITVADAFDAVYDPTSVIETTALAVAVFLGVSVLWTYSPLPNSNGGAMASSDRGRYWGFTPPDEEVRES